MLVRHVLSRLSYAPEQLPIDNSLDIILDQNTVVNRKIVSNYYQFVIAVTVRGVSMNSY